MIYQTIKIPNSKFQIPNSQSGVTLLLSILILSSITAISFSLATVLFVEIRTSGDLLRTEPALYGANAMSEEALFKIKRQVSSLVYSTQLGDVQSSSTESSLTDPVQVIKIPATSNTFANTTISYPIYSEVANAASGYTKIDITYPTQTTTAPIDVYVCEFDINFTGAYATPGPACSSVNASNSYWDPTINLGGGVPYSLNFGTTKTVTLDPSKQQQLILVNPGGYADTYVQITTYGPGDVAKGLPYFAQTAVQITSNQAGVTRRIKLVTPNPAPSTTTSDTIWFEDALPAGAVSQQDPYNWISSGPSPFSGSFANQSVNSFGNHQQYFLGASPTFAVNTGDTLFAYVYLDPSNPPAEVMLQWNNGDWEHRAYWGANSIGWGTDGTNSRRYMGALPATGTWVKLSVPASMVGLEGSSLNGMAFTLYDGVVTWDHVGKTP